MKIPLVGAAAAAVPDSPRRGNLKIPLAGAAAAAAAASAVPDRCWLSRNTLA